MDENKEGQNETLVNRRRFMGALGAAAVGGALLQTSPNAHGDNVALQYEDSFGNIVPVGDAATALGIVPPPVSSQQPVNPAAFPGSRRPHRTRGGKARPAEASPDGCTTGVTSYASGYPKYNFLLIMVDQMRSPTFWLPSGGQQAVDNVIQNIAGLRDQSLIFPNYFVAATVCGPSRACLTTGLYSQQTCIFRSQGGSPLPPSLMPYNSNWPGSGDPGFPTIGNVLTQVLPIDGTQTTASYDCTWIGKWHLSCAYGVQYQPPKPGENGPSDYGFTNKYSLPNATVQPQPWYPRGSNGLVYPSPNGYQNQGCGGDFLDSEPEINPPNDFPAFTPTPGEPALSPFQYVELSDAAIATAFTKYWLLNPPAQPWFCAVSFVNPHDIDYFPYPFGLTSTDPNDFDAPSTPSSIGYQPAPVAGSQQQYSGTNCAGGASQCSADGDTTTIPAFPASLYTATPNGWNYPDDPSAQPYNPLVGGGGKPGLQAYFQEFCIENFGKMKTTDGWLQFLNYYFWLQSCVDLQVGRVINALKSSPFASNTIVIFTSDHGDYAGSHSLQAKGGALYDESLNVPLYVSFPSQRAKPGVNTSVVVPYVCSSVDILPMLYSLALGNSSWRNNPQDMVYYLRGREAIEDAIYESSYQPLVIPQRRLSSILLANPVPPATAAWQLYQPFVLHTADDFPFAKNPTSGAPQPSHAIAFRTVDITNNVTYTPPYGGGKLGIYSYWYTCNSNLTNAPIVGLTGPSTQPQYEFYNYSQAPPGGLPPNPGETGNQAFDGGGNMTQEAQAYWNDFFNQNSPPGINVPDELYYPNQTCLNPQVQAAIQFAFNNYMSYLTCAGDMSGSDGLQTTCTLYTCEPTP